MYFPLVRCLFLHTAWVMVYCPFTTPCRTPLNSSCMAGLMVIYSLSFCLSGKVIISSSFLKESFTRYRTLGWQIFFSQHFEYTCHCFLASKVSDENPADNPAWWVAFLWLLSRIFNFVFQIMWLWLKCMLVWVSEFILFGILWALDVYMYSCLSLNLGIFHLLFLQKFSLPLVINVWLQKRKMRQITGVEKTHWLLKFSGRQKGKSVCNNRRSEKQWSPSSSHLYDQSTDTPEV